MEKPEGCFAEIDVDHHPAIRRNCHAGCPILLINYKLDGFISLPARLVIMVAYAKKLMPYCFSSSRVPFCPGRTVVPIIVRPDFSG